MNQVKRIVHIDVVSGIMISWMLLMHCRYFSSSYIPLFQFLGFYMPWFFYKSGMFFTPENQMKLLKKDAYKFLRYFVVYSFIGWIIWCVCRLMDNSLNMKDCFIKAVNLFITHGNIPGNGALWFLLSLFLARQFGNIILKTKTHPFISSLICFAFAYLLYKVGWYHYSWWFGNLFSGLCFFILGYHLKNFEQNTKLFIASIFLYGLVVFTHLTGFITFPCLYMHANKMYCGSFMLFFPTALAGIYMTNYIFFHLNKKIKFKILENIGRNSMNFYVTHWILFTIVTFIAKSFFHIESSTVLFFILLGTGIIFLPLISKFINLLKKNYQSLNMFL